MAINDLIDSLEKVIDFLRKSNEISWANDLEEQYSKIQKAFKKKDLTSMENSVDTIKSYFGGMGSLNDIIICRANKNVPKGFSQIMANKKLEKLLDDVFMWCFFWNIETNNAKKIYLDYLRTHPSDLHPRISCSSSNINRYIKKLMVPLIHKKIK